MSIATEITRLQGIKTDIRTALVTQGIATASSHNMADFSTDILAIQGGSEGVYITVTCDSAYQGYDIILSANESELDRKQCPSSSEVNFFVSADDITLPATFTISNSLNDITNNVSATMYGWYSTELNVNLIIFNNGVENPNYHYFTQNCDNVSITNGMIQGKAKTGMGGVIGYDVDITNFSELVYNYYCDQLSCTMNVGTNVISTNDYNKQLTYDISSLSGITSIRVTASNERVLGLRYLELR